MIKLAKYLQSKFSKIKYENPHWIASEGYEAARAGKQQTDNPYHDERHDDWNLGWIKYYQWHGN